MQNVLSIRMFITFTLFFLSKNYLNLFRLVHVLPFCLLTLLDYKVGHSVWSFPLIQIVHESQVIKSLFENAKKSLIFFYKIKYHDIKYVHFELHVCVCRRAVLLWYIMMHFYGLDSKSDNIVCVWIFVLSNLDITLYEFWIQKLLAICMQRVVTKAELLKNLISIRFCWTHSGGIRN